MISKKMDNIAALRHFFIDSFKGHKRFLPKKGSMRIMDKALKDRKNGDISKSENSTVAHGQDRLEALFTLANMLSPEKDILIVSKCLDENLYTRDSICQLFAFAANNENKLKILFSTNSSNTVKFIAKFPNSVKKISEEAMDKLGRFVITGNALCIENSQKYEAGHLSEHKASFFYNIDIDNKPSECSDFRINKMRTDFLEFYDA